MISDLYLQQNKENVPYLPRQTAAPMFSRYTTFLRLRAMLLSGS